MSYMLKRPKQFVTIKKSAKTQTTAVSVLYDFSGSISVIRDPVEFALGSVGRNFWRLKDALSQSFYYDLSYFTGQPPVTIVGMEERLSSEQNDGRLVAAKKEIASGGNDILLAMQSKREEFLKNRDFKRAKVKYLILFTDGMDRAIIGDKFSPEMRAEMQLYEQAGIDVIAIGIGEGSKSVQAFNGNRQHYIQIQEDRPYDIAEAIARIAEYKLMRSGSLPPGNVTNILQIGAPVTVQTSIFDPMFRAVVRALADRGWTKSAQIAWEVASSVWQQGKLRAQTLSAQEPVAIADLKIPLGENRVQLHNLQSLSPVKLSILAQNILRQSEGGLFEPLVLDVGTNPFSREELLSALEPYHISPEIFDAAFPGDFNRYLIKDQEQQPIDLSVKRNLDGIYALALQRARDLTNNQSLQKISLDVYTDEMVYSESWSNKLKIQILLIVSLTQVVRVSSSIDKTLREAAITAMQQ